MAQAATKQQQNFAGALREVLGQLGMAGGLPDADLNAIMQLQQQIWGVLRQPHVAGAALHAGGPQGGGPPGGGPQLGGGGPMASRPSPGGPPPQPMGMPGPNLPNPDELRRTLGQ